jgi:putative Holliday junction resolvase
MIMMTLDNEVLTLTDEEGNEHQFSVIDIVEMDSAEYAILLPMEETEEDAEEAIILRIDTDEDGSDILVDIEDDEEWEKVADMWTTMMDDEEA